MHNSGHTCYKTPSTPQCVTTHIIIIIIIIIIITTLLLLLLLLLLLVLLLIWLALNLSILCLKYTEPILFPRLYHWNYDIAAPTTKPAKHSAWKQKGIYSNLCITVETPYYTSTLITISFPQKDILCIYV